MMVFFLQPLPVISVQRLLGAADYVTCKSKVAVTQQSAGIEQICQPLLLHEAGDAQDSCWTAGRCRSLSRNEFREVDAVVDRVNFSFAAGQQRLNERAIVLRIRDDEVSAG